MPIGAHPRTGTQVTCTLSILRVTNGISWLRLLSNNGSMADPPVTAITTSRRGVKTQYLLHNASGISSISGASLIGRSCLASLIPRASFTFTLFYTLSALHLQATDFGMPTTSRGIYQLHLALAVLALFDQWRKCPLTAPSMSQKLSKATLSKITTSSGSGNYDLAVF